MFAFVVFYRFVFPCKSWIPIGESYFNKKEGKVLDLKDVEQSMVSSVRSECNLYRIGCEGEVI